MDFQIVGILMDNIVIIILCIIILISNIILFLMFLYSIGGNNINKEKIELINEYAKSQQKEIDTHTVELINVINYLNSNSHKVNDIKNTKLQ